jgi:hypothetical protein
LRATFQKVAVQQRGDRGLFARGIKGAANFAAAPGFSGKIGE